MKHLLKKIIRFLLFVVVAVLAAGLLTNGIVLIQGGRFIRTMENITAETGDWDCILVLGCGVRADGTPSPMLRDRLDRAKELYDAGLAPKILVSGDHQKESYDEVNHMKQYLIDAGVPSEDIFMDHAGFSTYESMDRARKIFQVKSCLIVTQQYHLYRAVYTARGLGIDAEGVAAKQVRYNGQIVREVREVLARGKDFLNVIVQPESVGGPVISLNGSGDVTNDQDQESPQK